MPDTILTQDDINQPSENIKALFEELSRSFEGTHAALNTCNESLDKLIAHSTPRQVSGYYQGQSPNRATESMSGVRDSLYE